MRTLTYWLAISATGHSVYNIRAKTKKEVLRLIGEHDSPEDFSAPKKVSVDYESPFELMNKCMDENNGYWE